MLKVYFLIVSAPLPLMRLMMLFLCKKRRNYILLVLFCILLPRLPFLLVMLCLKVFSLEWWIIWDFFVIWFWLIFFFLLFCLWKTQIDYLFFDRCDNSCNLILSFYKPLRGLPQNVCSFLFCHSTILEWR